jgi:hypothetical protein
MPKSKTLRAGLPLLLALAACGPGTPAPEADAPGAEADEPAAPEAPADDLAARAAAAGLTEAQAQQLVALDVPVVVPVLPEGWALTAFEASAEEYEGFRYPYYRYTYGRADGACFALEAASEGVGDTFLDEPPHRQEVAVRGVATYGPVLVGWAGPGEVDPDYDVPHVRSEWFGADGLAVSLGSNEGEGCRRIAPEDAAALLASARYLDPADDALALGPLGFVEFADPAVGDLANGPTPEAAATQVFARPEGEGGTTAVEVLRQRPRHAVVLVTHTNLPDDSIRDERVRVVLRPGDEGWLVTEAGQQVRCRDGRGHADWGPEPCL